METLYTIAAVLVFLFVGAEVTAGIILYRNRAAIGPRIRHLLGLDADALRRVSTNTELHLKLNTLNRKLNYICKHVKFEREVLRKTGILVDDESASLSGQVKIGNGTQELQRGVSQFQLRGR